MILALKYNSLRLYNHEVCFILLLSNHSGVENLDKDCTHPVQVCTTSNITEKITKIHSINFNGN